ncbi:MAG: hypothetical protein N2Z76_05090 [Treponemataceae bacterium]|nr:hypothetical protein [Treponemataceae bacterium]
MKQKKQGPTSLLRVISRSLVRTFVIAMGCILLLWTLFAILYTIETVRKDSLAVQGIVLTTLTDAIWEMDTERLYEQASALFYNWKLVALKITDEEDRVLFEKYRNDMIVPLPQGKESISLSRQGYALGTVSYVFDYSAISFTVVKGILFFGLGGILVLIMSLCTLRRRLLIELQKPLRELKSLVATYSTLLSEENSNAQERDHHLLLYDQVAAPMYIEFEELYGLLANLKNTIFRQIRQLEDAHREREILLREINHRVLNNLQILVSMLNQQIEANQKRHEGSSLSLKKVIQRIEVLAEAYNQLWEAKHLNGVEMAQYLERIVGVVQQLEQAASIQIHRSFVSMVFPLDFALACGLICYELLINALLHAYDKETGDVWVSLEMEDMAVSLSVYDKGRGCSYPLEQPPEGTLGFRFIQVLAQQIHGSLSKKEENGCHIVLTLSRHTIESAFKGSFYSIV